jgi:dUTP pyrophosphatase
MVKSKSGLNIKHDITAEGVIDEGFSGEVMVKLYNHGNRNKEFKRGDKITQVVVLPVMYPTYVEKDKIAYGDRGVNGYGSTGR